MGEVKVLEWVLGIIAVIFTGGIFARSRSLDRQAEHLRDKLDQIHTVVCEIAKSQGKVETQIESHKERIDRLEEYTFHKRAAGG